MPRRTRVVRPPAGALLALLALLQALPTSAQVTDPPVRYDTDLLGAEFHRGRREAVLRALPDGDVAVVLGAPERNRSNDTNYEYRQSSDLLYLTGTHEPGSALVLVPAGVEVDGSRVQEILFVPPRDPAEEVWLGRRFGTERAREQLGVQLVLDNERFEEVVAPLLAGSATLHRLPLPDGVPTDSDLAHQIGVLDRATTSAAASGAAASGPTASGTTTTGVDSTTLRVALGGLRAVKTDEEMVLLRKAIDITVEAHREVMRQVEPGWAEYEIEALVEYTFKRGGAEYTGFPSIVGSGENSVILHYETNRRTTEPDDVVVIDVGAEVHGYSADVTRTIPVDGVFSPEQRAIYEIVLRAQEAGIAAARAGSPFFTTHRAAAMVLAGGLAELGLIDGPTDGEGLGRFFMHGTSHYLGLDVHDIGSYGLLEVGNVVTVEPGIYVPAADDIDPKWWNIGVRIEDDVLVTEGDPIVLSAGAPRTVEDVEALMRGSGGG